MELDAEHRSARDEGGEPLAVLGGADDVRRGRSGAPRTSARGRRGAPLRAVRRSAAMARSKRTSFQPICGIRSPPACKRVTSPPISRGPAVGSSSSERSNSSCIPRQIPSSGVASLRALADQLDQPELAQVPHRPRERADAGDDEPVAARSSSWSLVSDSAGADVLERLLAPSGGCPSRSRRRAIAASRQRPLRARHAVLGRVERDRGAQRPRERLERRLDHVMGVRAALDREVQGQLGVDRQRAEELLGQLVVEVADRAGRERAPRTRTGRARRCRSRTTRGPRPSGRSPRRSARCRRGRRAPGRAPGRCRSRRPRRCGGRRSRDRRGPPRRDRGGRGGRTGRACGRGSRRRCRARRRRRRRARGSRGSRSRAVLRSIIGRAGHRRPAIVANACLHRSRVQLEALGARHAVPPRARAPRRRAIRTSLKLRRKCVGRSRRGEAGSSVRGQDVVRAGDVVAERGAAVAPTNTQPARVTRAPAPRPRPDQLQVLGGERLGERDQPGPRSAPSTRQATAPVSAPCVRRPSNCVEQFRASRRPRPPACRAVLGLRQQVERERLGIDVAGRRSRADRSGRRNRRSQPGRTPAAWPPARTGCRADDHVDGRRPTRSRTRARRSPARPPSGRRRATPGEPAGREHDRIELAVPRPAASTRRSCSTPAILAVTAPITTVLGYGARPPGT